MADITKGTGADSMEDIRDAPALESVGVDPDAPIAQADTDEPGEDEEDDDEFDDEDAADEDDDDEEDAEKTSDTDTE
jgi:hypothetical protein